MRRTPVVATSLFFAVTALAGEPWPSGSPPSVAQLTELSSAADELYQLERREEFLEAFERGEDREHISVFQDDIDSGLFDLDRLFRAGDALFEHEFRNEDGLGARADSPLLRIHTPSRGGLDTYSCAGCHSQGGPDGAGSAVENAFINGDGVSQASANVRNPPHALGLGLVQALGEEMTRTLQLQRSEAQTAALDSGRSVLVELEAKGVRFGSLIALPDGTLDTSGVEGVSKDLVLRPFGWKGDVARLRRFVENASRIHFGVQSHSLALAAKEEPDPDQLGPGPWYDPDQDGVQRELEEGTLTAGAVYLALVEVPTIIPPTSNELLERWARGSGVFDQVGCNGCHQRKLRLDYAFYDEVPDDPAALPVRFNLLSDGDQPRGNALVELFSDLKRHDLGEELADPHENAQGIPRSEFLTRPLWGIAESGPFLHDGRATTFAQAIAFHGGEAAESRSAFQALDASAQGDLAVFLSSLSRTPKLRVPR